MSASSGNSSSVAIVTGASRGIGVEVAAELARRGYRLGLLARNQKLLQEAARKLEGAAPAVRALAWRRTSFRCASIARRSCLSASSRSAWASPAAGVSR